MAGKKESSGSNTIAFNRKARHEYNIEEELEAGIILTGSEVKALREGKANISDAYAGERKEEIWLYNAHISEYAAANNFNHEPRRPRKLLLHQKQIKKIVGRLKVKGVTLVPLSLYFNTRGLVKIKLGVGTGKKSYEKRETIKKRDWQRDKARIIRDKNS